MQPTRGVHFQPRKHMRDAKVDWYVANVAPDATRVLRKLFAKTALQSTMFLKLPPRWEPEVRLRRDGTCS